MKALDPIDATPEKRIYSSIIADYDIEKALCELIDNVIDNGKNYGLKEVYVDILLDVSSQTIYVKDNSGGVNNLKNLISPGSTGNDSSKELIGMFGVGTKRATVALAKNICIKTRKNGEHTKILNYDDQWINDPENWFITPYEANKTNEEINDCETVIELSNLIKNFNDLSVKNIKDHFSKVYAYFISEGFLKLNVNSEEVTPLFFNNWSYSPKYTPTKYWNFIDVGDKKVKIEIIAGLSRISNPSGNWGVYIYCNKRLIGKNLQNFEVGFGKGLAGNPHPTISLVNILVFIEGDSKFMPWNSSKSEINYSHPIFKKIQPNLQELVKRYAKISRSLVGNWEEKLFKFSSGEIKEKNISFDRVLSRELPPLPPPKVSEIAAMKDINKGILESKPWTKGIFGGIEAKEIILRKEFSERNRFLLIILDSTLEIAFKEFLVNDSGGIYNDAQLLKLFSNRYLVHSEVKKYPKGKKIYNKEWKLIKFYYELRCKLIHQRGSVDLQDGDIEIYSKTVKSVLKKLFNLNFDISNN